MKRKYSFVKLTGLFIILILSSNSSIYASKFMASDFGWQKVGQDSFLITLTIYKDCNGAALGTAKIYFRCATTNTLIDSLFISVPTGTDVTPICSSTQNRCQSATSTFPYGIQRYIFQGIINLSNAGSCCNIRMYYSDTNRSDAITTINDTLLHPPFYTEAIFNRCISPADHAPIFSYPPVEIICVGQDHFTRHGTIDNDKDSTGHPDSIVYDWAVPLKGHNDTIRYKAFYSYNKPLYFWGFPNDALPFPRGIHLDWQTGDIGYRPMKSEVTIMAVKIKEYRKGSLIGEVRRDILTIVIDCKNNKPVIWATNNVRSWSVCAGNTFNRNFWTTDADTNDILTISYDNSLPGATWTDSNGLSNHPTGTIIWTPTDAHVSSLPYTFYVSVKDNACPVNGTYLQVYQLTVKPKPLANIVVSDSGCGIFWFKAWPIIGNGPTYIWQGQSFNFTPSTGSLVNHRFKPGIYPYTMTMVASGCDNTYYDTIVADTSIWNSLAPDTAVCIGSTMILKSTVILNSGPVKIRWGSGKTIFNSDTSLTKTIKVTRDTIIWSAASDSTGCESKDSVKIKIHKPIGLNLGPDVRICSYGQADIMAGYLIDDGAVNSITWTDLKTNKVVDNDTMLSTSDSSRYTCMLIDTFGCAGYDTIRVVKSPEVIASVIGQIICYGDEAALEADITGGGKALYRWYDGTNLIGGSRKIKVKPLTTTNYWLKVIETISGVTCTDSTMVQVKVNPLPVIKIYPIDKRCVNGSIISLNNFVRVGGIYTPGGIWTSTSYGLIYGDKFNPVAAGVSSPPGWKVKYEYTDPTTGCYNKDSAYVTIFALPRPFAGYDESVCTGTKKSLVGVPLNPPGSWIGTGVGGGNTNWWFNPDTVGVVSGGSYEVIYHYTDNNQCVNEDTVKFMVKSKPPTPLISLSPTDSFLECGLSNGLYKWFYRPDFSTVPTIISYANRIDPKLYSKNCYFSVMFTDSNGCVSDTSTAYHFVYNSIDNQNKLSGFRFYPNPAHSELFIENPLNESANLLLTDIFGRTLSEKNIFPGKNTLPLQTFKPGLYFIFLDGYSAGKLLIE